MMSRRHMPRTLATAVMTVGLVMASLGAIAPAQAVPAVPGSPTTTSAQRMLAFTMTSEQTRDLRGVEPSLYRGRYYRASVEKKRQCIVKRESEGHYDVVSRSGYHGAYQVSRALARGVTWMMLKEHKALLGEQQAEAVLAKLRSIPMSKWPRYWQDAAFHTIYNWEYTGSGKRHWYGGRWSC